MDGWNTRRTNRRNNVGRERRKEEEKCVVTFLLWILEIFHLLLIFFVIWNLFFHFICHILFCAANVWVGQLGHIPGIERISGAIQSALTGQRSVAVICEIFEFRVFTLDEILIPPVFRTRPTNFPYKWLDPFSDLLFSFSFHISCAAAATYRESRARNTSVCVVQETPARLLCKGPSPTTFNTAGRRRRAKRSIILQLRNKTEL